MMFMSGTVAQEKGKVCDLVRRAAVIAYETNTWLANHTPRGASLTLFSVCAAAQGERKMSP
jgi:hypothetical protein